MAVTQRSKKDDDEKSLAEMAKEEADQVEAEAAEMEGLDTGPADGEPEEPQYTPKTPTKKDVKNAEKVWDTIKTADIMGADAAVSALIALIDIHPMFTPPPEWPGNENEEYCESEQLQTMAKVLIKGCKRLIIEHKDVVFLWRNKDKWVSAGKTVRGNAVKLPTRVRHLLKGKRAVIEVNYFAWKTLNPLQRVFTLYHEIRTLAADGTIVPPDFTGYYDEMEVFGPRVFREMMELARVVEEGSKVTHEHQLPLFDDE